MTAATAIASPLPERAERAADRLPVKHARRLRRILELEDFTAAARHRLPRAVFGYVANGAEDETALHTNRSAFQDWRFITRVLVGVADRTQETRLFGRSYAAPFGIAPMGASAVVAYDGDVVLARAAAAGGVPFVLSASSITPLERVAQAAPGQWFAAYQAPDPSAIERMVDRVARAGFEVLVVTADLPVGSNRVKDRRNGFSLPIRPNLQLIGNGAIHPGWSLGTALRTLLTRGAPRLANLGPDGGPSLFSRDVRHIGAHDRLSWEHIRLMRRRWQGPLVVKGILSAEDARIARDLGVDGVVVSNHGGRQLADAATPLQVLPEIVAAAGHLTIMIDGGFRRGGDVLTALALGAHFVFIGRPFLYAAAVAGEAGVLHAIALLSREIDIDMALLGLRGTAMVTREMLFSLRGWNRTGLRAEPG